MSNWKHGLPLSERWHLFQTVPSKQSWFTVSTESKVGFFFSLWFMFLFSVSAAPLWPSQLVDHTGFSKQDLVSLCVLLYVKWWVFQCFLGLFYSIIINKLPVTQMTSPLRLKQNTCSLFQKWSSLYFCYIQSVYVCETEGKKWPSIGGCVVLRNLQAWNSISSMWFHNAITESPIESQWCCLQWLTLISDDCIH